MANTRVRFTVGGNIYYQIPGSDPVHVPMKYDRGVLTPEQPWQHSPSGGVGPEWIPVDLGWLADCCGTVVITNREKSSDYPQENDKIIELAYGDHDPHDTLERRHLKIPPGEVQPVYPSHPKELYLRCVNGPAKYSITVFPR